MQKWEYLTIWRELDMSKVDFMTMMPEMGPTYIWVDVFDKNDSSRYYSEERRLNKLGEEGWELVSVLYDDKERVYTYTYYLKRPIPIT